MTLAVVLMVAIERTPSTAELSDETTLTVETEPADTLGACKASSGVLMATKNTTHAQLNRARTGYAPIGRRVKDG